MLGMKIGKAVQFKLIPALHSFTHSEIERLQCLEYCKITFNQRMPVLILSSQINHRNNRRYYSKRIKLGDSFYRVTNDWYERHENMLYAYLRRYNVI